ncbi:uncharacterized protein VTP21DRAFT_4445 [Calcarisporiella thermophila]|uniref:uncharacterized protein n=1 Tax=Calcarisporiella thermophila TaxID=911321 RepID=UPI00374459F7
MSTTQQSTRSSLFTCLACHVAFHTSDHQKEHYRTDWHRYNLKRKVAELPPVTAEQFANKVLAQQAKTKAADDRANYSAECVACGKVYSSENAYNNHLQSRKHKEAEIKYEQRVSKNGQETEARKPAEAREQPKDASTLEKKPVPQAITEATTEAEMLDIIDKKIEAAVRLEETDCLFCTHQSSTFEKNIEHMTVSHSFFIPDIEYLVDLSGLIKYLGEKISVGNLCIYCNGRGRQMNSLEAVRKHMADKGHWKIAYDTEDDVVEIADYYDFSSSYPDAMETDGDGVELPSTGGVQLAEDEMELILPSGNRIGHRSLHRYYKQSLRPTQLERDSAAIGHLITHYENEGMVGSESGGNKRKQPRARGLLSDRAYNEIHIRKTHDQFRERRNHLDFDSRIGCKANKLQRHFRAQIL